jgi:hypothetical protein
MTLVMRVANFLEKPRQRDRPTDPQVEGNCLFRSLASLLEDYETEHTIEQPLITEPDHVTVNCVSPETVTFLNLYIEFMSLQIDGDLACQTDYKFLNWMLKRKTEF